MDNIKEHRMTRIIRNPHAKLVGLHNRLVSIEHELIDAPESRLVVRGQGDPEWFSGTQQAYLDMAIEDVQSAMERINQVIEGLPVFEQEAERE